MNLLLFCVFSGGAFEILRVAMIELRASQVMVGADEKSVLASLGPPDYQVSCEKLSGKTFYYGSRLPLSYVYPMAWMIDFEDHKVVSSGRTFSP